MEKIIKGNKKNHWCAVTGCMRTYVEKRHFFLFPKEHDRWLAWVQACRRFDLLPKGPEYVNRNCRLCHLHFNEKDYKIKGRARLHPDAVPTKFLELTDNNSATSSLVSTMENQENYNISTIIDTNHCSALSNEQHISTDNIQEKTTRNICLNAEMDLDVQNATPSTSTEENCNSDLQLSGEIINNSAEIAKPSTSGTCGTKTSQQAISDNSPRKTKLRMKNQKLKAQIKTMRETIRRL
ncbi:uncharacterized protein LOC114255145 [Monomorium pharaonis]|uniref:uncharacterized protein LOC114255145 n=1 Tax=Monomorium pharaonis TaxID=307658 RepID=UPI0017465A16|nr:uncharacterized protein LOC114255145 [Monomorium pharaonis]XP_036147066.1 uncharacterized protein LOC114255145 [Monomorium pharaonis]XP_036147067.1 uncharacterized protein LOC114255145 [Monomorium pharaonis]XP_036147068.1 uncharacterized protein LOC114255145 [Monomorium pharaonis]